VTHLRAYSSSRIHFFLNFMRQANSLAAASLPAGPLAALDPIAALAVSTRSFIWKGHEGQCRT